MMRPSVSDAFLEALKQEFNGRLRLRWSVRKSTWQIEARSYRPVWPHKPVSSLDDEGIRAMDGYDLVLEIAPGDRVKCPRCGRTTHIPVMRMTTAVCEVCHGEFRAIYWPLSDSLLTALRRTDPMRGGLERVMAEVEGAEESRESARRRDRRNQTEAIWKDEFNRVFEIPQVGYTGREHGRQPLPADLRGLRPS